MAEIPRICLVLFLVGFSLFFLINPVSCNMGGIGLDPGDRAALLHFKSQVQDPLHSLTKWDTALANSSTNTSIWTGFTVSERTGRLFSLNLSALGLSGQVPSSVSTSLFLKPLFCHTMLSQVLCLSALVCCKTLGV